MPPKSSYDLIDRLLEGQLAVVLAGYRADGLTFDQMSAAFADRGIAVSRETLRRWVNELDGEDAA